jgi:orotate phosphoribosyltransferase
MFSFDQEQRILMIKALESRLKIEIIDRGFEIRNPPFTLSSGELSPVYFDLRKITLDAACNLTIGRLILAKISNRHVDAIGGPESGATPIMTGVILESLSSGHPIQGFSVLKSPNKWGQWLEGNIYPGNLVIVVEDVVTTARTVAQACQRIIDYGCTISSVISILDRESGGRKVIEKMGIRYEPLLTQSDFQTIFAD